MADTKVGIVTHYYDKISVAIIDLAVALKEGDKIKIVHDGKETKQVVQSMQVDHKQVKAAKKGETVGLQVDKPVKAKAEVYKVKE